jgi:ESCRT-I complex subunit VPS28
MYSTRQQAYAPTPYIPRSTLSATINLDEVRPPALMMESTR